MTSKRLNRSSLGPCTIQESEPPAVLKEGQEGSVLVGLRNGDSQDGKGWKLIISGRKFSV